MIIYQEKLPKTRSAKYQQKALILPKIGLVLLLVMMFMSLLVYLVYEISNFIQPPDLVINNMPDQITTTAHAVVVSGKAEIDAQVFINDQVIITDENGNFQETVTLRSGLNTLRIVAKKKHSKERVIDKQILVEDN